MGYTQPPNMTKEERESFLQDAKMARFCSKNPDGTIHAATVSCRYVDGQILCITPSASRKARNVRRDGDVSVLIDVVGSRIADFKGLLVYGEGTVAEATLSDMIAVNESWMAPDRVEAVTRRMRDMTEWVMVRVNPKRFASWDYGKDEKFASLFQE
jgi:general stress protein 26